MRDVFSVRRALDTSLGIPRDFLGQEIIDPDLAALAGSPT